MEYRASYENVKPSGILSKSVQEKIFRVAKKASFNLKTAECRFEKTGVCNSVCCKFKNSHGRQIECKYEAETMDDAVNKMMARLDHDVDYGFKKKSMGYSPGENLFLMPSYQEFIELQEVFGLYQDDTSQKMGTSTYH